MALGYANMLVRRYLGVVQQRPRIVDMVIESTEVVPRSDKTSVVVSTTVHGRVDIQNAWIKFCLTFTVMRSFGICKLCPNSDSFIGLYEGNETPILLFKIQKRNRSVCKSGELEKKQMIAFIEKAIEHYRETVDAHVEAWHC